VVVSKKHYIENCFYSVIKEKNFLNVPTNRGWGQMAKEGVGLLPHQTDKKLKDD